MNTRLWIASVAIAFMLILSASANAALITRLGGQAVYDTDRDITWLADANLAASQSFGVSGLVAGGLLTWDKSNEWIAAMNASAYLGYNDWRLPMPLVPDSRCVSPEAEWLLCNGGEMGHLFYRELFVSPLDSVLLSPVAEELAKFTNFQSAPYWYGLEYAANPASAWVFRFDNGNQNGFFKGNLAYALVVRSGDVLAAVPTPTAAWLMLTGLLSLLGSARRRH